MGACSSVQVVVPAVHLTTDYWFITSSNKPHVAEVHGVSKNMADMLAHARKWPHKEFLIYVKPGADLAHHER